MIILSCTYCQTYRKTFVDHFWNANRLYYLTDNIIHHKITLDHINYYLFINIPGNIFGPFSERKLIILSSVTDDSIHYKMLYDDIKLHLLVDIPENIFGQKLIILSGW